MGETWNLTRTQQRECFPARAGTCVISASIRWSNDESTSCDTRILCCRGGLSAHFPEDGCFFLLLCLFNERKDTAARRHGTGDGGILVKQKLWHLI